MRSEITLVNNLESYLRESWELPAKTLGETRQSLPMPEPPEENNGPMLNRPHVSFVGLDQISKSFGKDSASNQSTAKSRNIFSNRRFTLEPRHGHDLNQTTASSTILQSPNHPKTVQMHKKDVKAIQKSMLLKLEFLHYLNRNPLRTDKLYLMRLQNGNSKGTYKEEQHASPDK